MKLEEMAEILQECIDETPYTDAKELFRLRGRKVDCLIHFVECTTDDSNYILYGFWIKAKHKDEDMDIFKCDFVGHFEMSGEGNHAGGFYPEQLEAEDVKADFKRVIKENIVPKLKARFIKKLN